ncbi:hypothetical protein Tco_0537504 [Tanacetum coccineum]
MVVILLLMDPSMSPQALAIKLNDAWLDNPFELDEVCTCYDHMKEQQSVKELIDVEPEPNQAVKPVITQGEDQVVAGGMAIEHGRIVGILVQLWVSSARIGTGVTMCYSHRVTEPPNSDCGTRGWNYVDDEVVRINSSVGGFSLNLQQYEVCTCYDHMKEQQSVKELIDMEPEPNQDVKPVITQGEDQVVAAGMASEHMMLAARHIII